MCTGRVSSSCSTSGTRRVKFKTNIQQYEPQQQPGVELMCTRRLIGSCSNSVTFVFPVKYNKKISPAAIKGCVYDDGGGGDDDGDDGDDDDDGCIGK
jgi:hypothetical protein